MRRPSLETWIISDRSFFPFRGFLTLGSAPLPIRSVKLRSPRCRASRYGLGGGSLGDAGFDSGCESWVQGAGGWQIEVRSAGLVGTLCYHVGRVKRWRVGVVGNFGFRSGDDRVHGEGMEGRITIEPGKRGGQPCVRGMRIAVADVLEYLSHGASREQLMEDFPELEPEDINACLAFAAHRERHLQSMAS